MRRVADFLLALLPVRVLEKFVVVLDRYTFVSRDGYIFDLDTPEELASAINADLLDGAATQDMPDYSEHIWVLNLIGMREVFAIARAEPDDELALLTLAANTSWTITPGDEDDD